MKQKNSTPKEIAKSNEPIPPEGRGGAGGGPLDAAAGGGGGADGAPDAGGGATRDGLFVVQVEVLEAA